MTGRRAGGCSQQGSSGCQAARPTPWPGGSGGGVPGWPSSVWAAQSAAGRHPDHLFGSPPSSCPAAGSLPGRVPRVLLQAAAVLHACWFRSVVLVLVGRARYGCVAAVRVLLCLWVGTCSCQSTMTGFYLACCVQRLPLNLLIGEQKQDLALLATAQHLHPPSQVSPAACCLPRIHQPRHCK